MAVALTVWNRPHYLRRVLDSWEKARGIGDVLLDFWCDPGCDEAVAMCEAVDFAPKRIHVNPVRLGDWRNVQQAFSGAFEVAPYVIHSPDDNIASSDILELHAWYRDTYADDQSVIATGAGRNPDPAGGGPAAVWRSQVMSWMSGFHRDRWEMIAPYWEESNATVRGWWGWMSERWCFPGGYDILRPALSRAQDIGEVGNRPVVMFDWHLSKCFSEDYPPQQFYEVTGQRERGFECRVEEA